MKMLIGFLLCIPMFVLPVYAEAVEMATELMGIDEIYGYLPEDAEKISGRLDKNGNYDSGGALKRLYESTLEKLKDELQGNIDSFLRIIMICLLCSVSISFCQEKKIGEYINAAGICAIAASFLGSMDGMINETVEALTQINSYSKVAMPAIFTAAAAGGAVVSASARYAAVSVGLEIMINTARAVIVPLIYGYLALALCKGLFDEPIIKSVQRFIKLLMGISMTVLTLTFSAYISLTGAVSGSADALAVKTARTVISNVLPVVGGMISDAASTVLTAANMIKTSAGAMSLVAVCAICAGPFVRLSVKMLLFKLSSAACDIVPGIRLSPFINDIGTALSFLLGLLGSVSIMLFVSIMSVIRAVTA